MNKELLPENIIKMVNVFKVLIYNENLDLLNKISFDNDFVFLEPLLFVYFNKKKDNLFTTEMLTEIMQGYFIIPDNFLLNESFNKNKIAYVPNSGYFDNKKNKIDEIYKIKDTSIELLLHPIIHLKTIFRDFNENVIVENKIEISKALSLKYEEALINAFQYIKQSNNGHFNLIQECCRKIVIFKTDSNYTNSFATINAHGIAFFNVYQEDYDEVFFVDDIAHQTGHIIMTTILFDRKKYFIIDENINLGTILKSKTEYRSFYTLFHALYTYYTTLLCLDSCIKNECFDKRQMHEANGRIGFYLIKYKADLLNFKKVVNHYEKIENVLTTNGIEIYKTIEDKYFEITNKYIIITREFNYDNQPYNFTFKNFIKQNHLKND